MCLFDYRENIGRGLRFTPNRLDQRLRFFQRFDTEFGLKQLAHELKMLERLRTAF